MQERERENKRTVTEDYGASYPAGSKQLMDGHFIERYKSIDTDYRLETKRNVVVFTDTVRNISHIQPKNVVKDPTQRHKPHYIFYIF